MWFYGYFFTGKRLCSKSCICLQKDVLSGFKPLKPHISGILGSRNLWLTGLNCEDDVVIAKFICRFSDDLSMCALWILRKSVS